MNIPKILSLDEYSKFASELEKVGYKYSMLTLDETDGYWYKKPKFSHSNIRGSFSVSINIHIKEFETTVFTSITLEVITDNSDKYKLTQLKQEESLSTEYLEKLAIDFLKWIYKNEKSK